MNDAVQINSQTGTELTCVYPHLDVNNAEGVSIYKELHTASGTMGGIFYDRQYVGKPIVCQQGGSLYVAGFADELEVSNGDTSRLYLVPLKTTAEITKN